MMTKREGTSGGEGESPVVGKKVYYEYRIIWTTLNMMLIEI